MRISKAAMQLRIPRSRIDYWVRIGILHPEEGDLSFEDLKKIRFIQKCQQRQISLKKIRSTLDLLGQGKFTGPGWITELYTEIPGILLKKEGEMLLQPESGQLFFNLDGPAGGGSANVVALHDPERVPEKPFEQRLRVLEEAYENSLDSRDTKRQKEILLQILSLDKEHTGAWIELGNLEFESGSLDRAIEQYEKALISDPGCVEAVYNIANIYYKQKKFAPSIRYYERCIQLDPDFPESYYNLGVLYYELSRVEPASFFLERYLDMDPDSVWSERAREILHLTWNNETKEPEENTLLPFKKPGSD